MDWLIETLKVVREVRDWTQQRTASARTSAETQRAVARAVKVTEKAARPLKIERIGPAERRAKTRRRPTREPRISRKQEIPINQIDPHALSTVKRLRKYGHKAYLVGGCVRDLLLGFEPKDFDIATDAEPEEVKGIFRNSRIIGRRFRLVHLYFHGGKVIEVSTFRAQIEQDEEGEDLLIRRDNVFGSEKEDALRRDFTVNGLFYDLIEGRVIDHVNGMEDIEKRYLRMIGDPRVRLREDPVRILRALRFTAKTNLTMDSELAAAIAEYKQELRKCAPARVLEETLRLLRIGHSASTVALMEESGVLEELLPEIKDYLASPTPESSESTAPDDPLPRDILFAHLRALDEMIAETSVSDAVVLSALIYGPLDRRRLIGEEADGPRSQYLADFLADLAARIVLTRRLSEHIGQIFLVQRHFGQYGFGQKRKRRRLAPAQLMRRGVFPDALQLYEIHLRASGLPLDEVEEWKERAENFSGTREDDSSGPRRRRRRRRR